MRIFILCVAVAAATDAIEIENVFNCFVWFRINCLERIPNDRSTVVVVDDIIAARFAYLPLFRLHVSPQQRWLCAQMNALQVQCKAIIAICSIYASARYSRSERIRSNEKHNFICTPETARYSQSIQMIFVDLNVCVGSTADLIYRLATN